MGDINSAKAEEIEALRDVDRQHMTNVLNELFKKEKNGDFQETLKDLKISHNS